ncbi:MAG TPA: SRPBCC family protein [Fontimonas sp.]
MPGTVRFHRILKSTPDKIYRAFITPAAMCKWLPPFGFTATMHSHEARVGGSYRMSFTNFGTDGSHSFGGTYLELKPGELLRYNDQFDDPNMPGQMEITVKLRAVACGTEIEIVQAGIPDAIPTEFCYLGWQESLVQLAQLVEPDIPDGA